MFLLLSLFKAKSFRVWSVLFCAVFFMTIWKVCVLFWVLLEVAFELCKMYLIFFFFEACTSCLPYEISDHKISLQIWSQFSSVLWQLFSGEFSWFAVFFPVLFLISFFSSIFDYVMCCFSLEEVNLPGQHFAGGVCRRSAVRCFRRAGLLPGSW